MTADIPQNRNETGKFKKGVSGNPAGRPKTPQEIKDIVKANTVAAINRVIYLMNNSKKEEIQLKAAQEILDRGLGKATQLIAGDTEHGPLIIKWADPE